MDIYRFFAKFPAKRISYTKTREYDFFTNHNDLLRKYTRYTPFMNVKGNFDVVRANLIIRALENKEAIEKCQSNEEVNELLKTLPYYEREGEKIFLPIYDKELNHILLTNPMEYKNKEEKDFLDPFDTYGPSLFNSMFTSFVLVNNDEHSYCYLDYDLDILYFINEQGRMDHNFVLFDKYIKTVNISKNNLMGRVSPVVQAYLDGNRNKFITALQKGEFVSTKALDMLRVMYGIEKG
ncbi:MAG: hypothetical protein LUC31_03470 [Coprobacillus sp.]|nr:hypothetical protein [Coprobacillus sp.]